MSVQLDKPAGVGPPATAPDDPAGAKTAAPAATGPAPVDSGDVCCRVPTPTVPGTTPPSVTRPGGLSSPRLGGIGLRGGPTPAPRPFDATGIVGGDYARLTTGAGLASISSDPPKSLPRAGLEELSWAAGPLLWAAYVGNMEAQGKKYYYWQIGGQQGPQQGAPNYFYRARLEGGADTDEMYHMKVFGLGTPLSYLGSHAINQALRGENVFAGFDPVEMARHTVVTAVAEDALYWILMDEPVDLMWLRHPLGDTLGDTFGKPSEFANLPYAYYFGLGAAAGGTFARHRVAQGDRKNFIGWGGDDVAMSVANSTVHGAHWLGALVSAVPMVTGRPLSSDLKTLAPVTLSAGWIHGFADVQAGVNEGDWLQTAAGVSALLSTYFQTSVNAAHDGLDARGYDSRLSAPQMSVPAVGFAALSVILKALGD